MDKIPIRLLYVEDDDYIRYPMAEMLARRVDAIKSAASGVEALELITQFEPDILLTDIKMPGMSGLELIRQVKAKMPEVRTIILSAHNEADFFVEAIEVGVDSFMIKPVNRQTMFSTLERIAQETISRRRAAISELRFRTLASAAADAIVVVDNSQSVTFWNNAAEQIFGYTTTEMAGRNLRTLFPHFQWTETSDPPTRNINSATELEAVRANGDQFTCEATFSPFLTAEKPGSLIIVRDVSERKRREAELVLAKENAEAATRAKQQFLSVMSHEIRTPLNGIIGAVNLLINEDPRADQVDYLKTLEFSGNQLLAIVNDILDFSKIEATGIEFESIEFNLKELVEGQLKMFSYKASDKGIGLDLAYDPDLKEVVTGDPMRLNQILTNLIGNAVKFTEKGQILVRVKQSDNLFYFEVEDTGIGIPAEKLETIFEFFSQADANTTRKYGGTGLGLAISKKLINLQGGTLSVTSEVGSGSTFTFSLPLKTTETRSAKPDVDGSGKKIYPLDGVSVLVVEDNRINQMIAKKFLDRWNCQTSIASNGFEALELIVNHRFDMVLMDLQMPELDGYETSRRIRAFDDDYLKTIPIVALTASAFYEVKEGVMGAGMTDILNKPFIPEELNRKIYHYINQGNKGNS